MLRRVYPIFGPLLWSDWVNWRGVFGGARDLSLDSQIISLGRRLYVELKPPAVAGVYLPALVQDDEYRDEFGFVFLQDGTAAPFYVSLPGTLAALHARFPGQAQAELDLLECLQGFESSELAIRALALGAWNALGQHLFKRAEFALPPRGSLAGFDPHPGERVGMVGYFCPVIDRLVERGVEVLVIEQQPGRVPARERVQLSEDPASLAECRLVYCTASTLVNGSLEQILGHCGKAEIIDLIGPSGSGLPDLLLARGIHAVGGASFPDSNALRGALANGQSWGSVAQKYELGAASYPGVEVLLDRVEQV